MKVPLAKRIVIVAIKFITPTAKPAEYVTPPWFSISNCANPPPVPKGVAAPRKKFARFALKQREKLLFVTSLRTNMCIRNAPEKRSTTINRQARTKYLSLNCLTAFHVSLDPVV